jgi:hypothetical protein
MKLKNLKLVMLVTYPKLNKKMLIAHDNMALRVYFSDIGDEDLVDLIVVNASNAYGSDQGCPLSWEPSGN